MTSLSPGLVTGRDAWGKTALSHSAAHGNVDVSRELIAAGADVDNRDTGGATPLHGARSTEIAELLLDSGAAVDAVENAGRTPLHLAAGNGLLDLAKLLIARGANVNFCQNENMGTALDHAIFAGQGVDSSKKHVAMYKSEKHDAVADYLRGLGAKTAEELGLRPARKPSAAKRKSK